MNTSTEQITDLIQSFNECAAAYNNKKMQIDDALAEAVSLAPEVSRTFYIDQANGDDSAAGTALQPLTTFEEALSRTPDGGVLTAWVSGQFDLSHTVEVRNRMLRLIGVDVATAAINFAAINDDVSDNFVPGFSGHGWDVNSKIHVRDMTLRLGAGVTGKLPVRQGVFRSLNNLHIGFARCDIQIEEDSELKLVSPGMLTFLGTSNVTVLPEMPGHWVAGEAAGTDPNTIRALMTNLQSV